MGNELPVRVSVGLVDEISQKIDKIKGKFPELQKSVGRVKANFDFLQESTKGFRNQVESFNKSVVPKLEGVGKAMTVGVTLPVVAGAAYAIHKFSEFEDALTEVQGSTNLSGEELKSFGAKMLELSRKTTFSSKELLDLTAAAGEAGVKGSDNLAKFALTLAQLGKTANIAGPEAASQLFKILQLTGAGAESVGNFGAALTGVQNKYGVSASKVLDATMAITREVAKFGLSSTQILGLAAAIEPLGFEAKAAEGAIAQSFNGINDAIREGGIKMVGLQKITGMTGEELKKQFKDNPQAVFQSFLGGLNKIDAAGGETSKALQFFGVSGDKAATILTSLGKNMGEVSAIQATAAEEFAKGTALNEEYAETAVTLSASMKKLKNNTDALAVGLGNQLAPIVQMVANAMGGLIGWFNEHPKVATFVASIAGLLAIVGPLLLGFAQVLKMFETFMVVMNGLSAAWAFLTAVEWASVAATMAALAPYILIGVAIAALVAGIWIFRDAIKEVLIDMWDGVVSGVKLAFEWYVKFANFMTGGLFGKALEGMKFVGSKIGQVMGIGAGGGPTGAATGAAPAAAKANSDFMQQTNNARVTVDVNAPQSTRVTGESQNGMMSINRGLAGAF